MKNPVEPRDIVEELQRLRPLEPPQRLDADVIAASRGPVQSMSRFEAALNALVGLGFASHVAGYLLASMLR